MNTVIVQPSRGLRWIDIRELWFYRSLVSTLTVRHLQVRYAQSILGVGWAVVQPLVTIGIFTIIFGRFAHVPSEGRPYLVFSLAGVVPWTYFAASITNASTSLSSNAAMVTKVYFPRLALPLSHVAAPLVDLAIGLVILLVMLLSFGIHPSISSIAAVPFLVLAIALTATGIGAGLAALDVQYRDVKHVVPFLLQVWMYASPVVYSMSSVPDHYKPLYALNPMAGIIDTFRSMLLGTHGVEWHLVATSLTSSAVVFVVGLVWFRYRERVFADVV